MTPYWWLSVVITGVLVSLVSAYLKSRVDLFYSRWSAKASERSSRRREERLRKIAVLRSSPLALNVSITEEFRYRLNRLTNLGMALFLLGQGAFLVDAEKHPVLREATFFFSAIVFMFGALDHLAAARLASLHREAAGKEIDNREEDNKP